MGDIDTVLAVQVDMQGRLMGKRFHANFFVDSAYKETHSCNYLLATDMDMNTIEGFKATSWAAGYGDYVMKPDLATLRRIPWLEGTALVICDVLDHHTHEDVPHSPRAVLKKQTQRLEAAGMRAFMASELEFFLFQQSFEELRAVQPARPAPDQCLQRRLSHLPDHQGGGCNAGHSQWPGGRRHSSRELQGRGRCRPGRNQRPLHRCTDHG